MSEHDCIGGLSGDGSHTHRHTHRHTLLYDGEKCCLNTAPCAFRKLPNQREGKPQPGCGKAPTKQGMCGGCAKKCPICGTGIKNPVSGWKTCGKTACENMVPRCLALGCQKPCQRDVWHGLFQSHCSVACAERGQKCLFKYPSGQSCDRPCVMNRNQDGYADVCGVHGGT